MNSAATPAPLEIAAVTVKAAPDSVSVRMSSDAFPPPYLPLSHSSLSSMSIALSSNYLSTCLLLLSVCVTWSITCSFESFFMNGDWVNDYSLLTQFLVALPEVCERSFLWGTLGLSIILLTREPVSTDSQHYSQFWHYFEYPRNWCHVLLPAFVSLFLCNCLFVAYALRSRPIMYPWSFVFFLLYLVWVLAVVWRRTVPHPLSATTPPSTIVGRRWEVLIATTLLVMIALLPTVRYGLRLCPLDDTLCAQFESNYLPFTMIVSLSFPALAGLVFLYHDRLLIRQRLIHSDLVYFLIILTFQLRLPHLLYQGWTAWFFPVYNACSATLLFRVGALIVYHTAFVCVQVVIRIFSLLAVTPAHSLAMIFYVQWFEDLMADFTFSSVTPFSTLFFINAAAQTIKCCIRDGNGIRLIVAYFMERQAVVAPAKVKVGKREQRRSSGGCSKTETFLVSSQLSVNPVDVRTSSQVVLDSVQRLLPASRLSMPSLRSVLYHSYVQSFDLILARHQTFLCESCSKCIIITAILSQYLMPKLGTPGGWEVVIDDSAKLLLLGGMTFLWGLQFITHVAILYVLGLQKSNLPSYIEAVAGGEAKMQASYNPAALQHEDALLCTDRTEQANMTSSLVLSALPNDVAMDEVPSSRCKCGSCVLSFPHYVRACERTQFNHDGVQEPTQSPDRDEPSIIPACSCLSRLFALFSPALDPCVHPVLNYWSVHRWFFLIQMMHWIWFVLVDIPFGYTDQCKVTS